MSEQRRRVEYIQLYEQGQAQPFCCMRVEDWKRSDFAFWLFFHTGIVIDRWQYCLWSKAGALAQAGEEGGR